ncbi:HelD family protein [Streptomyces sp. NPDC059398]|uniref:HelD family protein n=1 Tax=Streptomyces sp. NPDC059398 TaxID=3346820 RepID=UPI0036978E78
MTTPPDEQLSAELGAERTYHDACRAALSGMAEDAEERVVSGENAFASGADAEVLGYQLRSQATELREEPDSPLFFGRLTFGADAPRDHRGQSYHIGRRRISRHPSVPPLVIDWRAPVSRAFYRASVSDPQGVAVRRRFGWAPWSDGASDDLTGLEDELLQPGPGPYHRADGEQRADSEHREHGEHRGPGEPGEPGEPGRHGAPGGSAILTAEIERPRVGPMRDIAATIQPEQDDLVRGELALSVCVQGAPGTGKTAVGLHRAAYLLYTYPQRIRRSGLLVLGPNRTFLAYISEVLPSLGEIGVRQSTVDDELARHPVLGQDPPAAAALKHDVRMAEVLRRALYARVSAPTGGLAVPDGSYRWRIEPDELARIVAGVREEAPLYAVGRERLRERALNVFRRQVERRAGPPSREWLRRMGRARALSAFVDAVWPKVSAEEVVAELLTRPQLLAEAADGVLSAAEQQAVRWPKPPRSWRGAKWSAADLVLIDEVKGLIERPEGYGHVVIDEAQDLSPMQCRAVARRVDFGSVTVLGDLAQGTTPWAARSWPEQLAHLGKPGAAVVPLTLGFRVPEVMVELANRLVGSLGVEVPLGRSMRRDGELTVRRVDEDGDLAAAVVECVRAALAQEGSVGVIAADDAVPGLRATLEQAGVLGSGAFSDAAPGEGAAPGRVSVVAAGMVKGLEYDHVVVAEPAAIVAAEDRGLHRLYVVLTRAVSRLDLVHRRDLPAPLTASP